MLVETRENYGRTLIYPVCETAKKMTELLKTKTLSLENLKVIRSLGFEIDIKHKKIDELLKV